MIDIKLIRENSDIVKQNIKNKFQYEKLSLVDDVIELDKKSRDIQQQVDNLRAERNKNSKKIGELIVEGKKEEIEELKCKSVEIGKNITELEKNEKKFSQQIYDIMMDIPNIMDSSVPLGHNENDNVELKKYGKPLIPNFKIPYHVDIMEKFGGIDLNSARRVSGNGFYYLQGNIARLNSAMTAYARDFMIDKGFIYCIPPFMIRSEIVSGVMSQKDIDEMMYKIEGEDLYLIGTSEHSMIGRFINQIIPENELPKALTSYSPCFRKEKGAHGIEERGVYRIHQFEKQEMVVICEPDESHLWYDIMWQNTVDLFRSLDIPVRTLDICSGDLADLKIKSLDIEAWSPRQKKYFEVGSCSNMGDAQARRLSIRVNGKNGKYYPHTLNNTVVAPPRMLIAFLENNYCKDETIKIPKPLQQYMGGQEKLYPTSELNNQKNIIMLMRQSKVDKAEFELLGVKGLDSEKNPDEKCLGDFGNE